MSRIAVVCLVGSSLALAACGGGGGGGGGGNLTSCPTLFLGDRVCDFKCPTQITSPTQATSLEDAQTILSAHLNEDVKAADLPGAPGYKIIAFRCIQDSSNEYEYDFLFYADSLVSIDLQSTGVYAVAPPDCVKLCMSQEAP